MNKKSSIIIFTVLFVNSGSWGATNCPNPISDWVRAYENTPFARSWDLVTDSQGNIFITGSFSTGIFSKSSDFDPTEGEDWHSANGDTDIFISKLHPDGSYAWTRTMGGLGSESGRGIVTNPSGDVFVVGSFTNTVDFDPTEGVDERSLVGNLANIFITKLNADGSYGWTLTLGTGGEGSFGSKIALDTDDNIYITGCFGGTVDFDPTEGEDWHSSSTISRDIYITKLFSDGSYGWTSTMGGSGHDCAHTIAVSSNGWVYVIGEFRGTVDFNPGDGIDELTAFGQFGELFVTKYFSVGSYAWTRKLPRKSTEECGVTVDGDGNVYITCGFTGTRDFDPTSGEDIHTANDDPEAITTGDIYVTKLFGNGSYGWTSTFGGAEGDFGEDIAIDLQGNLYVTGHYRISAGNTEIMAMKLLPDGTLTWLRSMGSLGNDIAVGIIVDNSGDVLLTGNYRNTVDFDPGCGTDEHSSSLLGGSEMFILKLTCEEMTADVNSDGFADLLDFAFLQSCFSGEAPTTCNNGCEVLDFDHDDDIDLDDYFEFIMFME